MNGVKEVLSPSFAGPTGSHRARGLVKKRHTILYANPSYIRIGTCQKMALGCRNIFWDGEDGWSLKVNHTQGCEWPVVHNGVELLSDFQNNIC